MAPQVGSVPGAAAATRGLSLSATADVASVSRAGQQVDYTFVVRNRGDQSVRELLVTAPVPGLSALECSPVALGGVLAAGSTTTCRATRTIAVADLASSRLTATVKATAKPTGGSTAVNAATTVAVPVEALPPVATDDTVYAVDDGPDVRLPGATNDRPGEASGPALDPSRTVLVGVASGAAYEGKLLPADGGLWSVLPDGSIRMRLDDYLGGPPTRSAAYRVYDTAGRSAVGHLTVLLRRGPRAATHRATTTQGQGVTVDLLATDDPGLNADGTRSSFDRTTLRVFSGSGYPDPYPTTEGLDGRSVDLAGAGRYAVGTDDRVTFTPASGFSGTAPPLAYTVRTQSGVRLSGGLGIEVQPVAGGPSPVKPVLPVATDDRVVTTTQIATAFPAQRNDLPGSAAFVNSKLSFPGDQLSRLPAGSTIKYGDGVTLTVRGEGTYLARYGTQDVLFTPERGFLGETTPVDYRVGDALGRTARATLRATVIPGTQARSDVASTAQGRPVTTDVLANDDHGSSPTTWTASPAIFSPELTTTGHPGATTTFPFREKLTVPGEGVYTVSPGDGSVTFRPEPRFVGTSTIALDLRVDVERPDGGTATISLSTTLTVRVVASTPVARADTATTRAGQPVTVPVLANDTAGASAVPLVGASVRLRTTPDLPAGSVLYGDAKTLVVRGRGTFLVSGTGQVTYVPLSATTGPVPTVGYSVADVNGSTARSTLAVDVG